jgi:hypothetical protein
MSDHKKRQTIYHGRVLEAVNYPSPFLQTMVWYAWVIGLLLLVSGLFPALREGRLIALLPGAITLIPASLVIWLYAWRRDGKRVLAECPLCDGETQFVVPSLRVQGDQPFKVACRHCPAELTYINERVLCYHGEG